ncbi:MAG: HEAT repeat domain-containing protein [Thermodesulfobacteriota bacterium]|nr:HEAT repeat domain-containing protein [Thermodesulfobacteriota bacterium]
MARSITEIESYRGRGLKLKVHDLLRSPVFSDTLANLDRLPTRKIVNALISFLYSGDDEIRWRAITSIGAVVAKLATNDMEGGRVIMRRLMWNLNGESGGIGWGSPEAMGEILACHEGLAQEYSHVLISYAREDGNYLEHEILQRGVLWGIGRVSQVRAHLVQYAGPYLIPYLGSSDCTIRGLAAWIMGALLVEESRPSLERLIGDGAEIQVYLDCTLMSKKVGELAEDALRKLDDRLSANRRY